MIKKQILVFLIMFVFGFFMSNFYWLYNNYLREKINKNFSFNIINFIDILFGILFGILAFITLFIFNYGEFRIYELIAISLGYCLHKKLLKSRGGKKS